MIEKTAFDSLVYSIELLGFNSIVLLGVSKDIELGLIEASLFEGLLQCLIDLVKARQNRKLNATISIVLNELTFKYNQEKKKLIPLAETVDTKIDTLMAGMKRMEEAMAAPRPYKENEIPVVESIGEPIVVFHTEQKTKINITSKTESSNALDKIRKLKGG